MNLGRDEAELTERLDERRRAADEAAQWERIRQFMRGHGLLGEFESDLRRYRIRWERRRGISLRPCNGLQSFSAGQVPDHLQVDCVAIRFHQYVSKALPRVVE